MKKYPLYQPSNIDWIGDIPNTWTSNKIKFTTYVKGRVGWHGLRSDEFTLEGAYLVTGTEFEKGKIVWDKCYHFSEERYMEDPFIQLKENDLLITKDGTIGKVALVKNLPSKASLNSGIMLLRSITRDYITDFMYWVLSSKVFSEFNDFTASGSTIQHLYQGVFENFIFPVPSIKEQNKIVLFLNTETEKIDTLISKKQKLISLLIEQRTATINQAVSRGIDPNVEMIDSGIEWLRKIPRHWEVIRLKYLVKIINGFAFKSSDFLQEGIQLIKIANLYNNELHLERQLTLLPYRFENEYKEFIVSKGDILISLTGTLGKRDYGYAIKLNQDSRFLLNQRVARIACIGFIGEDYILNLLHSNVFLDQLFSLPSGTKQGNFSSEQILSIKIGVPQKEIEQKAITEYIKTETKRIELLLRNIQKEIDLLQEYRIALISEVVTGKIDVRQEVLS